MGGRMGGVFFKWCVGIKRKEQEEKVGGWVGGKKEDGRTPAPPSPALLS